MATSSTTANFRSHWGPIPPFLKLPGANPLTVCHRNIWTWSILISPLVIACPLVGTNTRSFSWIGPLVSTGASDSNLYITTILSRRSLPFVRRLETWLANFDVIVMTNFLVATSGPFYISNAPPSSPARLADNPPTVWWNPTGK